MRVKGNYVAFETKSYTIEVSPKDVMDLRLALKTYASACGYVQSRVTKWIEMLNEADNTEFGITKITTKEY